MFTYYVEKKYVSKNEFCYELDYKVQTELEAPLTFLACRSHQRKEVFGSEEALIPS